MNEDLEKDNDFAAFLHERIRGRGFTPAKLSELSGIAPEHIEHLLRGEFDKLPSAPYVRGYVEKLGNLLEFEAGPWWHTLRQEGHIKSSGGKDELPKNRFAPRPVSKYLWSGGVLVLLMLLYLAFRLPAALGSPGLSVTSPESAMTHVAENAITLKGEVRGVDEVVINSEHVPAAGGMWEKTVPLQPGLNTVEIVAKKFLGGETKLIRQIVYEPQVVISTSTAKTPRGSNTSSSPMAP